MLSPRSSGSATRSGRRPDVRPLQSDLDDGASSRNEERFCRVIDPRGTTRASSVPAVSPTLPYPKRSRCAVPQALRQLRLQSHIATVELPASRFRSSAARALSPRGLTRARPSRIPRTKQLRHPRRRRMIAGNGSFPASSPPAQARWPSPKGAPPSRVPSTTDTQEAGASLAFLPDSPFGRCLLHRRSRPPVKGASALARLGHQEHHPRCSAAPR